MAAPLLSPREWTDLWAALKDYLGKQIDADDKVLSGFLATGDLAGAAPFGGLVAANRNTLARMREMEQGASDG